MEMVGLIKLDHDEYENVMSHILLVQDNYSIHAICLNNIHSGYYIASVDLPHRVKNFVQLQIYDNKINDCIKLDDSSSTESCMFLREIALQKYASYYGYSFCRKYSNLPIDFTIDTNNKYIINIYKNKYDVFVFFDDKIQAELHDVIVYLNNGSVSVITDNDFS